MHSFAVQVEDLDATLRRLEPMGVTVGNRIEPEIVFTKPAGTAGLLVEWASHVQSDDPRWGAPEPVFAFEPALAIEHMAYVAALVRDPIADGRRLAELLDTDLVEGPADAPGDVPHCVLDLGDCALALYPIPSTPDESTRLWGGVHERPRCVALALSVADLGLAERILADAGQHVLARTSDGRLVLDPASLPFPVIVTEELLDGDPRRRS
jgi:hypothetical protein